MPTKLNTSMLLTMQQRYEAALQNFRGLMSSKQNLLRPKGNEGKNPAKVHDYRILGNSDDNKEQGIAALKLIHGQNDLNKLALDCFNALVDLCHAQIELHNAKVELNEQSNGEGSSAKSVASNSGLEDSIAKIKDAKLVPSEYLSDDLYEDEELMASLLDDADAIAMADSETLADAVVAAFLGDEALEPVKDNRSLSSRADASCDTNFFKDKKDGAIPCSSLSGKGVIKRLVVGMSGGADSTLALVLACALRDRYHYQVQAVHCIHKLDPDDDIWLSNNQSLCERLKVDLKTPVLNIVYGNGVSPEEVSRDERYRSLMAEASGVHDCLIFGHQADDQVESFLLALKRGSGPQGLSGMTFLLEDERGIIIRPLLSLHKIEVEQLLTSMDIPYVYDLSNGYLKFERNFMRLKVLTQLRSRFAGIDRAILRSQSLCAAEHDLAQRYVEQELSKYIIYNTKHAIKGGDLKANSCPYVLPSVEYVGLNFKELDLSDKNLVTMLLRTLFLKTLNLSVELNIIERCYELMIKAHDKNGLIKLDPSLICGSHGNPLAISTFLDYLFIYEQEGELEQKDLQGCHCIDLKEPLIIGSYRYTLSKVGKDEYDPHDGLLIPVLKETSYLKLQDASASVNDDKQKAKRDLIGLVNENEFFILGELLWLDFDYAGSLKLKANGRNHSREVKKLFIENEVAPWWRKCHPLIKGANGSDLLALGSLFTLGSYKVKDLLEDIDYFLSLKIERVKQQFKEREPKDRA